jgi:adenylate cyclase
MGETSAYIVIQGPGHNDTRIALREGITSFGRLPSNDVILLGDLVSRHHARIIYFDGKASIQDLGSHNGSWVNEERVTTRALNPGDAMRVGNFRITFMRGTPETNEFAQEGTASEVIVKVKNPAPEPDTDDIRPATPVAPEPPGDDLSVRRAGQSNMVKDVALLASGERSSPDPALFLLYRVTEALTRAKTVREFLEQVVAFTLERVNAEAAILFRVHPEDPEPARLLAAGPAARKGDPPVSMSVVRWTVAKNFTVYSKDISADLRFRHGQSVMDLNEELRTLVCAPIAIEDRVLGALYMCRSSKKPFQEAEVDLVEAICHLAAAGFERLEIRRKEIEEGVARELLARSHSSDVVERIMREASREKEPRHFLEARMATVCFLGIQGFTSVAEQISGEDISDFLSTYLDEMTARIFSHRGTVHSLLGDEIVAVYGAPYSYGNDAARAVIAALDTRTRFDKLVQRRPALGPLRLSVGIATGRLLAGAVGPSRRLDYTVLGEVVRVAARIRALAPPGTVLISASTLPAVSDRFETRLAGRKQLRPRQDAEEVYEVLNPKGEGSQTHFD